LNWWNWKLWYPDITDVFWAEQTASVPAEEAIKASATTNEFVDGNDDFGQLQLLTG